jgi:hypothetical protein
MADSSYRPENISSLRGSTAWGAIWAGLFTFIAIWSVFEFLGVAIFGSARSAAGSNLGLGIWSIVLTAVAMYIAGRETGRLAGLTGRYDGLVHGMIMFGLSVTAAVILTMSGRILTSGIQAGAGPYVMGVGAGWITFVALFLGWLGALVGASSATPSAPETRDNVRDIRPAA